MKQQLNRLKCAVIAALTMGFAGSALAAHTHCVCGDGKCTAAGHTHSSLNWTAWTQTTTLPTTEGNYYLANDVTLSSTYQPPTGVNLCLNGKVVKGNGACTLVNINSGAAFTLTDCDKTTTHNFSVDANGLWTLTDTAKTVDYADLAARPAAGAVVALAGGALTGGYINGFGTGGVLVKGVFTMYGGNLVGNRNIYKHGGAICIGQNNSYSATLAGGRICGNYAAGCGGAVQQDGSCVSNLRICGADVSFNAAGNKGGAINSDSAVTVTGGRIAYNKATGLGSAMSLAASSASVSMTGGSITHNESSEAGSCGAVCFDGTSSYVVGGTLLLDENYAGGSERNLYLAEGKTVTISTTTPLAAGAKIGVTTETKPTSAAQLVPVTSNRGEDLAHFTSDEGYLVVNEAGKVQLKFFLNVAFHANHADVTRDGAAFSSTNAVLNYGSTVGIPQLACEGLTMVGWAKTDGATEPEYTDAQVATISTESGSSHDLYAVWKATVRIPVFVAFDGLTAVPTDGREYTFKLTQRSGPSVMPATSVVTIPCPTATGDVARVGFGTNDVTNPFTVQLSTGTYVYMIEQTTTARHGEKLDTGYWLMSVEVNTAAKPYAGISSNAYAEEIDELGEDSFKAYVDSGEASFSAAQKALVFGGDTQTVIDDDAFNRAVVKSQFAIDFTKSFSIGGKVQVGAAADGSVFGFVPASGAPDIETNQGSSLGIYGYYDDFWEEEYYKPAQGKGIFLEFDTLGGNDSTWGDDAFDCAHFAVMTTDTKGRPAYTGKGHAFDDNYALPTGEMSYSIEFDASTKKLTFKIVDGSTVYGPWVYDDPVSQFGKNEAYMLLAGAMRYGPEGEYVNWRDEGDPAPKTKMTLDTFAYIMNQMAPGAVDNTFRNRQEALVTYIADGGGVFAPGQATTNVFANDARYVFPKPPTRTDSYKYAGWTNALGQAISEGQPLGSIADCEAYVTWDPILVKVTVPALEHTTPTVLTNGLEIAAPYMVLSNDLVTVVYTADDGYIFPDGKMTRTHEGICASTDPTVAPVSEVRPVRDLRDYVIVDEYERNPLFEDWNPDDGTFVYDGVAYTNGVNAFRSFGDAFATESFHLATNILTFGYQTIATNVNFITDWRLTLKGYTTFSGEDVVSIVSVGTTDAGAGMSGSLVDITNRVAAIVGEGAFILSVTNGTPGAAAYKADLEAIIGAAEIEVRYANFEPAREKETEPESGKEVTSETFVVDDQSKIEKDGTIVLPGADTDGRITVDISPTTTNDVVVAGKLQSREWDVVIVNETVQTLAVGAIETGMNVLITNMTDVGRIITLDNVIAGKNIKIDNNGHLEADAQASQDITIRNSSEHTIVGTYKAGGTIDILGEYGSLSNAVIDAVGTLTLAGTNVISGPVDLISDTEIKFVGKTLTAWSVAGDNTTAHLADFGAIAQGENAAFGILVDGEQETNGVNNTYFLAENAAGAWGATFALSGTTFKTNIVVGGEQLYIGQKEYTLTNQADRLVFRIDWGVSDAMRAAYIASVSNDAAQAIADLAAVKTLTPSELEALSEQVEEAMQKAVDDLTTVRKPMDAESILEDFAAAVDDLQTAGDKAAEGMVRFAEHQVEAEGGTEFDLVVYGGSTNCSTAATVNFVKGTWTSKPKATVNGKRVRFPIALNWAKGDREPKVVTLKIPANRKTDRFFALQLGSEVASTVGTPDIVTVTVRGSKGADDAAYVRAFAWPANGGKVAGARKLATKNGKATLQAKPNKWATFAGWYRAKADDPEQIDLENGFVSSDRKIKVSQAEAGTYFAYFTDVLPVIAVNDPDFADASGIVTNAEGVATCMAGLNVTFSLGFTVAEGDTSGKLTVSKLPKGLKYNRTTGLVTGVPKKAGTYTVRLTGKNKSGRHVLTFDIVVLPMPEALVGTFKGDLTDAAQAVVGSVTLKVADAGSLSARVKYGRKSVSFTAKGFVVNEGYDALLEKKNTGTVRIVIGRDAAGNPDGSYTGIVQGEKFDGQLYFTVR